jgi:RIO kinase 1
LKEQAPSDPEKVYEVLLTYVERLYRKAELVHGDLSEYNVMMWRNRPVLFDMAQAVPTSHPMAEFFLRRDLTNMNRFFKRLGVKVLSTDEAYRKVVG